MSKNLNDEDKIDIVSKFIDDLNDEKKPESGINDLELEQLYETIRSVKRQKSNFEQNKGLHAKNGKVLGQNSKASVHNRKGPVKHRFSYTKGFVALAAVIVLFLVVSVVQFPTDKNENIVQAMVKAYEGLESYNGTIEIKSYTNDQVEFIETIEIMYKKPNKFTATHSYDNYTFTQLSDGDALYTIEEKRVLVDYTNPEKELWRYHLGQQIEDIQYANNITAIGTEVILGREATIYQYGYADDYNSYKIWVDNETKLPLQKELIIPENRRIVNRFIEFELNPSIEDSVFTFVPTEEQEIIHLNRKAELSELKGYWMIEPGIADLLEQYFEQEKLNLEEVVMLTDNIKYGYLVKIKDNEGRFIDIYLGKDPEAYIFSDESQVGLLGDGWIEVTEGAINVFKVYIGKSNTIRWIIDNSYEITLVSDVDTQSMANLLEAISGDKIEYISQQELKATGVESIYTKEGH